MYKFTDIFDALTPAYNTSESTVVKLAIVWSNNLSSTYCCSALLWNAFGKILYIIQLICCVVSVGPSQSVHHLSTCLDVKEM